MAAGAEYVEEVPSLEHDVRSCYAPLRRRSSGSAKEIQILVYKTFPVELDVSCCRRSFGDVDKSAIGDAPDFGAKRGDGQCPCREHACFSLRCGGSAFRGHALVRFPGLARLWEKIGFRPPLRLRRGGGLPERLRRIRNAVPHGDGPRWIWFRRVWFRFDADVVNSAYSVFRLAHDERASLMMAARPSGGLM